jgi:hypothetical protein
MKFQAGRHNNILETAEPEVKLKFFPEKVAQ